MKLLIKLAPNEIKTMLPQPNQQHKTIWGGIIISKKTTPHRHHHTKLGPTTIKAFFRS
jgi:hypothetical protein